MVVLMTAASAYSANPWLTFTGGFDAPLVITLETPVEYVATLSSGDAPAFVFKNVGEVYDGIFAVEGDITYSINGGAAIAITGTQWGFSNNDVTVNDFILFGAFGTVDEGDVITLSAGTLTTVANMPGDFIPASGPRETFISDQPGNEIGPGAAVPEPTSMMLGAAGLAGLLLFHRTRAKKKA